MTALSSGTTKSATGRYTIIWDSTRPDGPSRFFPYNKSVTAILPRKVESRNAIDTFEYQQYAQPTRLIKSLQAVTQPSNMEVVVNP